MVGLPSFDKIPVVILCGGKGLRIREISELLPKPMLNVGNQPIIWHIMRIYAHYGFTRFILCLGEKGDQIRDYFFNRHILHHDITLNFIDGASPPDVQYHTAESDFNMPAWSVTLVDTGKETMTGGRVARVAHHIDTDYFMLTYGDGLGDVNIPAVLSQHIKNKSVVTVTGVHPPSRFGNIVRDGEKVVSFSEKPQTKGEFIAGGYMVANRDFIENYLSEDEGCVLEIEGLGKASKDGGMGIYKHEGFWLPMDTSSEYLRLNNIWNMGEAPWKLWQ